MMKKRYLLATSMLAVLPVGLAVAAQNIHVAATVCSKGFGNSDYLSSGPYILNWGSSGINIACAMPFTSTSISPVSVNPSATRVDYVDNNSNSAGSGALGCQMWLVSSTGTSVGTGIRYSCSTAGGCADGGLNSYVGTGNISWTDTIGATANTVGITYECSLPGYDAVTGSPTIVLGLAVSTSAP